MTKIEEIIVKGGLFDGRGKYLNRADTGFEDPAKRDPVKGVSCSSEKSGDSVFKRREMPMLH